MAPEVADRFEALQAAGRIVTEADSIVSLEPHGERVRVFLRTPGAHELDEVEVDRVINCSGAGCDLRRQAPPVLAGLLAAGRARPDELGLGLDVAEDGALLDAEGLPSERLFASARCARGSSGRRSGSPRSATTPAPWPARSSPPAKPRSSSPLPTEPAPPSRRRPTEWEAA